MRRASIRATLDIAPLLDVVFLLLVFLLLAGNFSRPEAMAVALPEAASAGAAVAEALVVTVATDGELTLDGRVVAREELGRHLAEHGQRAVEIRADREADVAHLIAVMDAARGVGIEALSVATVPATP
jgi:biopolymer transport protein ExbD